MGMLPTVAVQPFGSGYRLPSARFPPVVLQVLTIQKTITSVPAEDPVPITAQRINVAFLTKLAPAS